MVVMMVFVCVCIKVYACFNVYECFVYMHYLCAQYPWKSERVSEPLKPELLTAMSCHVGAGTQTQVLWKTSKCS